MDKEESWSGISKVLNQSEKTFLASCVFISCTTLIHSRVFSISTKVTCVKQVSGQCAQDLRSRRSKRRSVRVGKSALRVLGAQIKPFAVVSLRVKEWQDSSQCRAVCRALIAQMYGLQYFPLVETGFQHTLYCINVCSLFSEHLSATKSKLLERLPDCFQRDYSAYITALKSPVKDGLCEYVRV